MPEVSTDVTITLSPDQQGVIMDALEAWLKYATQNYERDDLIRYAQAAKDVEWMIGGPFDR